MLQCRGTNLNVSFRRHFVSTKLISATFALHGERIRGGIGAIQPGGDGSQQSAVQAKQSLDS
jgi:hypothetical protein